MARSHCSSRRVPRDERHDFESFLFTAFFSERSHLLDSYRGDGPLAAYLRVVIHRLLLDYRVQKWGKWRPSAQARRLGRVAVDLERLIDRDGYSRWEAIRHLRINGGVDRTELDLLDLAGRLPGRGSRRAEGEEALAELPAALPASARPDRCLDEEAAGRVRAALHEAIAEITPEARRLVALHFVDGLSIAEIARRSGADQRRLYRKLERALGELREGMLRRGIDRAEVLSVLERAA